MKENKIIIHILTGFLGSGKTTVLRDYLANENQIDLENTAIIINEIGEIGIDHLIIDKPNDDISILDNGCLCCQNNNELKASLNKVALSKDKEIKKVIIETSGLASVNPILNAIFNDKDLSLKFKKGSIITTVDVKSFYTYKDSAPELINQVICADKLLLTKIEGEEQKKIEDIKLALSKMNSLSEIIVKNDNVLSYCMTGSIDEYNIHSNSFTIVNHSKIQTVSIKTEKVNWKRFSIWLSMLLYKHKSNILRIKGILESNENGKYFLLNSVQTAVAPIEIIKIKGMKKSQLGLVFIVKNINTTSIVESFSKFQISEEK